MDGAKVLRVGGQMLVSRAYLPSLFRVSFCILCFSSFSSFSVCVCVCVFVDCVSVMFLWAYA